MVVRRLVAGSLRIRETQEVEALAIALAQPVGYLVDNAVKYTASHSAVSLQIERCNDRGTEIVVADNGPGITDADKPRVTQRFYRSNATCATGASDSGLALSQRLRTCMTERSF
jgi:signal transduction histidine kinase